ncbi:thioredoxin family protein [Aquimarina sp. BL5]|uniref:VPGUxxT family thioredoxin-like (seleno)protein, type 2 n=1 Tax=Aquimarina sp. BL5 TaxID=1714860 RepID=UPI000E47A562|nr:VPGUxxT family thioredoxin-like (seleno)protein, type 2 [Aquimarina sp. BL5]AXT53688.1 thioredoxin family protein [Aquimarina sp. BL5]RKM91352.1 thioredoxin family protein [Aquimarina sp. BL5]
MSSNFQLTLFILLMSNLLLAQKTTDPDNQSEELGKVRWLRNYDDVMTLAKKENKDVLILFQEVPGCSTCRNYGHNVLSHPLIVEAIENSFVPLAIFNNKGGKDAQILRKYNEPSWNNPVIRIVNSHGDDVVNRIGNDYSALRLCKSIQQALIAKGQIVPEYINLLEQELLGTNPNKAYYKMSCFWTGEKELGKLPAVLNTESGFINHSEVVEVTYNPKEMTKAALDAYAKSNDMGLIDNKQSFIPSPKDVHYYLQQTKFIYLPLTELQKTKINSALGNGQPTKHFLSPKQQKWLKKIKKNSEVLFNTDFTKAWTKKNKELETI